MLLHVISLSCVFREFSSCCSSVTVGTVQTNTQLSKYKVVKISESHALWWLKVFYICFVAMRFDYINKSGPFGINTFFISSFWCDQYIQLFLYSLRTVRTDELLVGQGLETAVFFRIWDTFTLYSTVQKSQGTLVFCILPGKWEGAAAVTVKHTWKGWRSIFGVTSYILQYSLNSIRQAFLSFL